MGNFFSRTDIKDKTDVKNKTDINTELEVQVYQPSYQDNQGYNYKSSPIKITKSPSLKPDKNSPKIYPTTNNPTQTTENSHILTQFILNYSLYDTEETPNNSKINNRL